MSKPADFQLGILDFFAVLLPGVVTTWLVSQYLPADSREALRVDGGEHANMVPWIVYLLTSYALGHFVFAFGSQLDPAYNIWRKWRKPLEADVPYQAAKNLRQALTPDLKGESFSTLKWARSYIGVHSAQARLEIDRIEATSKFFRSIVIVALLLVLHFLVVKQDVPKALAAFIFCFLSFERFFDQRWKMTELAYATAIIVYDTKASKTRISGERPERKSA